MEGEWYSMKGAKVTAATIVSVLFLGLGPSASAARPIDVSIAKTATGIYRSPGQHSDPAAPPNPQTYSKKVAPGASVRFFIKLKNPNPRALAHLIRGSGSSGGFDVTYTSGGVDITSSVTACGTNVTVPREGHRIIVMIITATSATSGMNGQFAIGTDMGACIAYSDVAIAKVRVP